ncbi:hypothetical protein C0995_004072 [Termitomyces sp. Mi166|nr:hypothetical protein C0995_004072 [Termitomyces sp. Mi166\
MPASTITLFSPDFSQILFDSFVGPSLDHSHIHLTDGCISGLHFFRWQGWTGLITCMIAEVILQMRLYAMYSLNKKVLALMGASFICTTAASAAIMGFVLSKITAKIQLYLAKSSGDSNWILSRNVLRHGQSN